MTKLGKRARAVLYAVVTDFIATGEPVGSRTLTKKYGFELSAATIRNVLADLEDAGYLRQPHTSAGRVPTEAAFRLFIDALMQVRDLSGDEERRIQELFALISPGQDMLRDAGRLLSDLSGVAAVMVRPRSEQRTVLKIRFIQTRPGELLSVIVLSDGTVENRFIVVEQPISDAQMSRVHNLLEETVGERTLAAVRDHIKATVAAQRDDLRSLYQLSLSLIDAAMAGADRAKDVLIEGQARLLERPEFADAERIKEFVRALGDRERLVTLLDRTLASRQVQVFLGEETAETVGYPVSLIAASYHDQGCEAGGAVGVIGPTRMDYPFLVPLVGATAQAMNRALSRARRDAGAERLAPETAEIKES